MKHKYKLTEILEWEMQDLAHFSYEFLDDEFESGTQFEHYTVKIKNIDGHSKNLEFRAPAGDSCDPDIEIELHEEYWEKIEWFESSIKYFWMALFEWGGVK